MSLIVLIGAQAVGKMTVGRELEKRISGKLLHNHQTLDVFATYLGFRKEAFELSDQVRIDLFRAFVADKENNATDSIIFTVVVNFEAQYDRQFLTEISEIFLKAGEEVYFIELVADVETRLVRNTTEARLAAKPSKRDIEFSRHELLTSYKKHRLESLPGELAGAFPRVKTFTLNNTNISPAEAAEKIVVKFELV